MSTTTSRLKGTGNPGGTTTGNKQDSRHPEYAAYYPTWAKIRDVVSGPEAVKHAGIRYLPSLNSQKDEDYERYKDRAVFLGATGRTLTAFSGLLLRKPPELETTNPDEFMRDVDAGGSTFDEYLMCVVEALASTGRAGTLVDWTNDEGENGRPYWSFYVAEDIVNWDTQRINGENVLTLLVLRERGFQLDPDTLEHDYLETYRIYTIQDGACMLEIIRVLDGTVQAQTDEEKETELRRRGRRVEFIPFVWHTMDGTSSVKKAPLADIAEVNVSHYQSSADLENGRHVVGLPTPYIFGADAEEEEKLTLGTAEAWTSSHSDAKCGFLEFTGSGLSELRLALEEKQNQMATLGARLLQQEKAAAEAFQTVKVRHDSEQSSLIMTADAASATVSACLQLAAWWYGTAAQPNELADGNTVALAKDFLATPIDDARMQSLIAAYQGSVISWPTLFYNLQQGEVYPDDWKREDEEKALREDPGVAPPRPDPNPQPAPAPNDAPPAQPNAA